MWGKPSLPQPSIIILRACLEREREGERGRGKEGERTKFLNSSKNKETHLSIYPLLLVVGRLRIIYV